MSDFASRLTQGVRQFGPLCVGIDPHPGMVPALFGGDTARGLEYWGRSLVEVAAGKVAVIKPQVGFFERLGPGGLAALAAITPPPPAARPEEHTPQLPTQTKLH